MPSVPQHTHGQGYKTARALFLSEGTSHDFLKFLPDDCATSRTDVRTDEFSGFFSFISYIEYQRCKLNVSY